MVSAICSHWDKDRVHEQEHELQGKINEQEHGLQGKIIQNNVSSLYVTQQESSNIQFHQHCVCIQKKCVYTVGESMYGFFQVCVSVCMYMCGCVCLSLCMCASVLWLVPVPARDSDTVGAGLDISVAYGGPVPEDPHCSLVPWQRSHPTTSHPSTKCRPPGLRRVAAAVYIGHNQQVHYEMFFCICVCIVHFRAILLNVYFSKHYFFYGTALIS